MVNISSDRNLLRTLRFKHKFSIYHIDIDNFPEAHILHKSTIVDIKFTISFFSVIVVGFSGQELHISRVNNLFQTKCEVNIGRSISIIHLRSEICIDLDFFLLNETQLMLYYRLYLYTHPI